MLVHDWQCLWMHVWKVIALVEIVLYAFPIEVALKRHPMCALHVVHLI